MSLADLANVTVSWGKREPTLARPIHTCQFPSRLLPILLPLPNEGSADSYILASFRGFLAVSESLSGPWPQPDEQGWSDLLPQQPALLHEILANTYDQGGTLSFTKIS